MSSTLSVQSAFDAGRRHQRAEFEKKLNERICSLKFSEQAAIRMYQSAEKEKFAAAREVLEEFLTKDLGGRIR